MPGATRFGYCGIPSILYFFPDEDLIEATTVQLLCILFLATLIRSAFGFGEALVAVPLLAFFVPLRVAAPLAVLVSITIAGVAVVQDWESVHVRSAGWLFGSTLLGIPLGLLLLKSSNQVLVKSGLAVMIVAFALYSLIGKTPIHLARDSPKWLALCGFCAGVLGGAYGMNGPPLVVYGAMRKWSPQHFRATLQGYFLPASIVGMLGYWLAGLWDPAVTHYYLVSLPVTVPTVFLGRAINRRLNGDTFLKFVYVGLVVTGTLLFAQAARGG